MIELGALSFRFSKLTQFLLYENNRKNNKASCKSLYGITYDGHTFWNLRSEGDIRRPIRLLTYQFIRKYIDFRCLVQIPCI